VIARFSIRYLAGESRQGSYSLWLSLTIGAVSLLAVSGNVLLLFVVWCLSSLGIHRLLTHYADRPAACRAAWMKFSISRIGDVALVGAGFLIYREFGSFELTALFAGASDYRINGLPADSLMPVIGSLLILGAAVKTAQFPFHSWLPETLEAPTPVSALMHAGIINAGGYLLVRLSPLLAWSQASLTALACLGAFTACFAALVMLTQTSIKKSLAWSTIAQMGFMMFQCGLGAFSAAMLHIIAHSLYKAHAFLNSGDVLNQKAATRGAAFPSGVSSSAGFGSLFIVTLGTVAIYLGVARVYGMSFSEKPGGFLLCLILCLGLSRWVWLTLQARSRISLAIGVSAVVVPAAENVIAIAATGFLALFLFETWLSLRSADRSFRPAPWLQAAYVHTSNGFYIDAALSRLTRMN
jgi:NAD(P)H-quinone oxidoreductase subunit 5